MKFSSSIDALQKENRFFRLMIKSMILTTGALLGVVIMIYDRPPIMLERSSHGLEILNQVDTEKTEIDIKQAIALMMRARFDSSAISPELFLNSKELVLRTQEQKELKSRSMAQAIVVRKISLSKEQALVDVDRVLAVGEIRSALKTQIKITFEETTANELNPYGLLLSAAEPIETKK